jgi:hypothetical protein
MSVRSCASMLLLFFAGLPPAVGSCLSSDYPRGITRKEVTLGAAPKAPFFYVRSFDYHYVVVFEPDALLQMLKGMKDGRAKELRSRVEGAVPLRSSFDLSALLFEDPDLFSPLQTITTVGLERGVAALEYLPTGAFEAKARMQADNSSKGYSLTFKALSGQFLVWDVRCIAD